ncbi:acetyl-lysine deacetylase [Deinococcus irradiatisoli]|uniref:[LysW]-lysine hydrolase n=1 Tax=Deinococcus irradiatisoli TaxID=2202254 RepID=A0A2Z3JBU6_9DEIO|nr:[LysW]-lysine hydrolase [Deinococcus irradiatisoli]AWN22623.1 acetyl-lysine deacetylase [Deinococcus irradiatisoli]
MSEAPPAWPDARDLIVGTVERASLSGQETEAAQFLCGWMQAHGFETQIDAAGNAVGVRGHGPLTVMLLGHIDTVPGHIPVRIDEAGVLHGRGSVDAKGSFCTFVAAVAGLPDTALQAATFVCVGATEEEAPSSKGARHAVTRYRPDYVLIGEPSGWEGITLGYKGRLIVKAEVRKANFHTAGEGTSAGDDLTESWFRVRQWAQQASGEGVFGGVQATVQALNFGSDGLEQRAQGTFGLRLPPHVSPVQAREQLTALLADLDSLQLDFTGDETAVRHERDSKLARALRVAIRQHGGTPLFKLKTGTSDMNVVAPHWPVPTLAYGPGDSSLDHTPEERLDLAEYDRAVLVLRAALRQVVGG